MQCPVCKTEIPEDVRSNVTVTMVRHLRNEHGLSLQASVELLRANAKNGVTSLGDEVSRLRARVAELEHKAAQYDAVVEYLHVADAGRYRADTIDVIRGMRERNAKMERAISDALAELESATFNRAPEILRAVLKGGDRG